MVDYDTSPIEQDEQDEPRRGSARERQRRRREGRPAMVVPAGTRLARPQLTPTGSFRFPEVHIPRNRAVYYVAGAAAVVIVVLVVLSRLTGAATAPQTPPNGLWLGTEWTYALEHAPDDVPAFVNTLRENRIGTVYAWVSWLKDDLQWGGRRDLTNVFSEVEEDVKAFAAAFNREYPEARLFGWVSVPIGPDGRDISDPTVQQLIADMSKKAVDELGFEGVHLNVEPVWNNDTQFLALLTTVRQTIGDDVLLSAAIPPDWSPLGVDVPVPPLIVPGTIWDLRYKQSVALLVDDLALMAYNSGLSTPADYSRWVAYQITAYADAVAQLDQGAGAGVDIMVGMPTYDDEPPGHLTTVENVASAADGVRLGLQQAGDKAEYVRGVAIYADWETDETEWAQFMIRWVNEQR